MIRSRSSRSSKRLRWFTSATLTIVLVMMPIPPLYAQSVVRGLIATSSEVSHELSQRTRAFLKDGRLARLLRSPQRSGQGPGMPPRQLTPGVTPQAPPTKAEHEARVASIRINPADNVTLQSRQPLIFTAVAHDSEGKTVHGLRAEWESSSRQVVFVKKNGEALAGKPGTATLVARVGRVTQSVRVTVVQGTRGEFGGKKRINSTRAERQIGRSSYDSSASKVARQAWSKRRHHNRQRLNAKFVKVGRSVPLMPLRDPFDDPLPDDETDSLYLAPNAIGSPPGKKKLGAMTAASATGGSENGNKNFSFALPVGDLPGRGIDAALALVYNSLAWHKSTSGSSTYVTYDVDSGWPSAGFRMGFGQIEDQGSFGFTLTEADGTRRALAYSSAYNYDTKDGSFIHFYGGSGWGTLYYPDGTRVTYGAAGGGYRSYPTRITDRNGNYLDISYRSNVGPKLDTITDTLARSIQFHYEASNGDLVSITQPALGGGSDLQLMRFYYKSSDIVLNYSNMFASGITMSIPPDNIHVLEYVYLPASGDGSYAHVGYKFDYSAYGMIYQITQYRGMTVSSTSETYAGSVSSNGSQAAVTTYDYPTGAGSSLTDVPTYTTRTDDWAGRTTSSAPAYTYSTSTTSSETISTVTAPAPDATITETHSIIHSGYWDDGLVTDTYVQYGSTPTVLSHTKIDWDSSSTTNPRISQVRTTDVPAGLTKATVLSYTTSYNNVSAVSERAFTTDGSVSSTELRRTETTYETSSNYTNRHLLHLPTSVKVFPGGSSTASSRVDYAYDNYGTSHANLTARADIVMHDDAFNPFAFNEDKCSLECVDYDEYNNCIDWEWFCPYDSTTDYRGNVTSVTTYPDASSTSGTITHSTRYDVAGNVTSADVDCCQLKTISYSTDYHYAYPTSVTSGDPSGLHLTTSQTYDFYTGLLGTTTDENGQVTTNYYNADSLRLNHINYPSGGGSVYFYYGDGLWADANSHYHYYTMVSREIDSTSTTANNWTDVYSFRDGRGAVTQTFYDGTGSGGWTTRITEYDGMGRVYRSTNPFFDGGYGGALTGLWTTSTFDHLGRVTAVTMPSGDDSSATTAEVDTTFDGSDGNHDGILTTATDQSLKKRRQKVDALGRVVRLDEPNSSGYLDVSGSVYQPTSYDYDVLGNLVKITQGDQSRYFKYDSLSRLIRERQVEQTVRSAYDLSDSLTGNSSWTRKLEYNSAGLVTHSYNARGVQTDFTYDGLNRVTTIGYSDSTPTAHYYYDSQTLPSGHPSYTPANSTGRLIAMTYGSGATGEYYNYNTLGRVVSQWQVTGSSPTTYSMSYAYNYGGALTSETYPSTRAISYAYGNAGRLATVKEGATNYANSLDYAPHGGLTTETFGNSMVHSIAYNHALEASQVKLKQSESGSELQRYDYWYGTVTQSSGSVDTTKNNGQIARIDGTINGSSTKEWDQRFVYDELGRLSIAAEYQQGTGSTPTWQMKYTYDRYGNRKQSGTTDNFGVGFKTVTADDIVASTNRFINTGSTAITYDEAGNITQDMRFRLTGSLGMKYAYDANGRQTSAKLSDNSNEQTSVYDCGGQRVQTTVGSTTRTMVYDIFGQDVADYSGSSLERENLYRGGQLLATYEASSSAWKYVLQDIQGSTRAVMSTGTSPTILARHDYLPFGEEIASGIGLRTSSQGYGETDTNRQKYGLTERNDTTGLDHTWFRKYESLSGRWTSPDPYGGSASIGDPQSFNRYSYTQNDPVNFVDPNGLDTCHVDLATGEIVCIPDINAGTVTIYGSSNSSLGGAVIGGGTLRKNPIDEFELRPIDRFQEPQETALKQEEPCDLGIDLNVDRPPTLIQKVNTSYVVVASEAFLYARAVFAEASGGTNGNPTNEHKAIASVIYNRLGASEFGNPQSITEVVTAPGQFQAVTGGPQFTQKFNNSALGSYQNLSPGDCKDLKAAFLAVANVGLFGPTTPFTAFRGGTNGPGVVIGGSRFGYPATFNPPRR
jgi:RHS repeat-associated protein